MKKVSLTIGSAVMLIAGVFALSNCGKSSSSGLSDVSLSSIPSASTMLAGTGANGILKEGLLKTASGLNLQSVTGTPPILKDLSSSNSDTYFFNGLVSTINTAATCSASNKNKFWGQDTTTPGPGGRGACMMAQGTAEALSRMMDGTSTLCYMKNIPNAASGVTITGSTASDAFKRGSSAKIVKVAVTNMTNHRNGERANMDVWFRIYGTDTNSEEYKYDMWMCQNSTTVTQKENLSLNLGTGALSITSQQQEDGGARGSMTVTATLKNENGTIKFDPASDRTAVSQFTGSWGTYSGKVQLTSGDIIKAWRYGNNSTWGSNKTYSVAAFSGTGVDNFRFLQGCFKGVSTPASGTPVWTYSGITEYRSSFYAAVSSSDLSPQCDAFSFTSDSFFSDLTIPTPSFSGLSCSGTPDITITMDFSNAGVVAVQNSCEGERQKLQNWSMCDSTGMRTAENYCRN